MDVEDVLGDRYRLVERLGEGGMAVVWRADDEVLRRAVAVKLLSPRFLGEAQSRARIRTEAQAVARLSHPHVASVYDYGESEHEDGQRVPYVVMELITGPSLAKLLAEGPLPIETTLRLCAEVAAALAAAHQRGIVHRDIKPANIMMTAVGAKVVDFGVAAVVGELTEQHPDGLLYGTPAYVSPERLEGAPAVPATDVYALGVLLYRLVAGTMPWSAESITQLLRAHMYTPPDPLPPVVGLPSEVVDICERCLAKDPADRPAAGEVARVLAAAVGRSVPITDGSGPSGGAGALCPPAVPGRRSAVQSRSSRAVSGRRRMRVMAATGTAVAVVAVAAVVAVTRWPTDTSSAYSNDTPVVAGSSAAVQSPGVPPSDTPGARPADSSSAGSGAGGAGNPLPLLTPSATIATPAPEPPTTSAPPTFSANRSPEPVVSEQTVESAGGRAVVRCTDSTGYLVSWEPKAGYDVGATIRGPADQVSVRFKSADAPNVTIRARCENGVAKVVIRGE